MIARKRRRIRDQRVVTFATFATFALLSACSGGRNDQGDTSAAASSTEGGSGRASVDTSSVQGAPSNQPAGPSEPAGPAEPAEPAEPADSIGRWGHSVLESAQSGMPATLRAVRVARNKGFERVVFEFEGAVAPGYRVSYVDHPVRQCGSGEVVSLPGDAWLEVKLFPAQAHDDAGKVTVSGRRMRPALANMKELALTCDFEADVTWVAGLGSPNDYRVIELRNPTRLVVDVRDR